VKDLDYYSRLPYTLTVSEVVEADGERRWQARLAEIPTLSGHGQSEDEALADLRQNFADYVRWRLDMSLDIAEPAQRS
jgi:predicted RNase H-like HicB family nuclease